MLLSLNALIPPFFMWEPPHVLLFAVKGKGEHSILSSFKREYKVSRFHDVAMVRVNGFPMGSEY